jgi:hypothetical protein
MVGIINRLKDFIRIWFTREAVCFEMPQASTQDTTRKKPRRRYRKVVPSERFVWGIIAVIIALIGLITLEAMCIVVTGTFNLELFSGISGIATGLVTVFVMGKRGRRND